MEDKKEKIKEIFLAFSFMSFISSSIVGCMALGYFAGKWLEEIFPIYPVGRLGGLLLGMFLAIFTVVKNIREKFINNSKGKDDVF